MAPYRQAFPPPLHLAALTASTARLKELLHRTYPPRVDHVWQAPLSHVPPCWPLTPHMLQATRQTTVRWGAAVSSASSNPVKLPLEHTPLQLAAMWGNTSSVHVLLGHAADPN